jgi:hypothetical protein
MHAPTPLQFIGRSVDERHPWMKIASPILVVTLCAALLAASAATPPTLEVTDCLTVESGTPVRVIGVVIDVRSYDSGTETLTLMDRDGGESIRVICLPCDTISLEARLEVAALGRVDGEVVRDASDTVIFAPKGGVTPLARSQFTLSTDILCENWRLFEFDRFNVSGELVKHADTLYLKGISSDHLITVRCRHDDLSCYLGQVVTLDCRLFVDQDVLVVYLWVYDVSA